MTPTPDHAPQPAEPPACEHTLDRYGDCIECGAEIIYPTGQPAHPPPAAGQKTVDSISS